MRLKILSTKTPPIVIISMVKINVCNSILGTLKEKFDKEYWSTYKAFEFSGYPPKYNWKDHQNRCLSWKMVH